MPREIACAQAASTHSRPWTLAKLRTPRTLRYPCSGLISMSRTHARCQQRVRAPDRVVGRFLRSISVRVGMKHPFQDRLQYLLYHHLCHPVGHGGNPQQSNASARLWNIHPAHRLGMITPRCHPIPDLVEIVCKIFLKFCDRLFINPLPSLVLLYAFPSLPNLAFGHRKRLCVLR